MSKHRQTDQPNRSGGPTSLEGKSNSSKNSLKHGCRSTILILPGENRQDFEDLYDRWKLTYQPQDDAELELVEKVILEKWFLLRNERRYSEMEQDLAGSSFVTWTDQQHKNYQLALTLQNRSRTLHRPSHNATGNLHEKPRAGTGKNASPRN